MSDDVPRQVDLALTNVAWPTDQNWIAWCYDPALAHNSTTLTAGTVYLAKVQLRQPATITTLMTWFTTAGATPTSNQNFIGLYDAGGNRLATVGVDSSVASTGLISATISTPITLGAGGYWVAQVYNASTIPTVARATGSTGVGSVANGGLATAGLRFCTNATSQTSLPATITLSSNTALNFAGPWVAVA